MPKVEPPVETFAKIKVVGVGGAGGAAINRMVEAGVEGVEFVAINTDAQALHHSKADHKVNIGKDVTRGLGAGADPAIGQRAAEESRDEITAAVADADMVFVTLGAGGGTGSGGGYIVAKAAQDAGALVVGFATKPFAFEGEKRRRNAEVAIDRLRGNVDTLIIIPNDKLLSTIDRRTPLMEAFKVADDVLRQGVQGISDLISVHGLINLDFADVKTVMANAGSALMGIGRASGENRATEAAQQAISSPLLEVAIDGARGILFNVIGGNDVAMHEINTVAEAITAAADEEATIIFGATINPELEGEIIVTVVATGFDESYYANRRRSRGAELERQAAKEAAAGVGQAQPVDEATMADLDMDLDNAKDRSREEFGKDSPTPNIWALPDEPAKDQTADDQAKADEAAEELERPSYLRRLFRRRRYSEQEIAELGEDKPTAAEDDEADTKDAKKNHPKDQKSHKKSQPKADEAADDKAEKP